MNDTYVGTCFVYFGRGKYLDCKIFRPQSFTKTWKILTVNFIKGSRECGRSSVGMTGEKGKGVLFLFLKKYTFIL